MSIGEIYQSIVSICHWCCWWPTDIISYSSGLHWFKHQHWSALLILYWHWWYLLILYGHWWYLLILYEHWWDLPINSEHLSLVLLVTNWHHFILISVAMVQTPTLVSIANPLLALVIFANPLWALVIFANPIWALVRFTNHQWELIIGVVGDQLTSFHTHQCCIGTTPSLNHQHWPALLILYWHCWYLLILYEHWWYLLILYEHWWYLPILYEHSSLVVLVTNWHHFILIIGCIITIPGFHHQHLSALLILYWHWWYLLILYEHWWYLLIHYEQWWHLPIFSDLWSLVLLVTNWHHFILISVALVPLLVWITNIGQHC